MRWCCFSSVRNDEVLFRSYGESGEPARQLDEDALFDIGSITKVFTGVLLAGMVDRGEVALEDPLSHFLPEGSHVPKSRRAVDNTRRFATHFLTLDDAPYAHEDFQKKKDGVIKVVLQPGSGSR